MSCNGCRVLRKGCSDDCMLRHCLVWIENPQAQANATVFVAKFFGRATLMSFLSSVPATQRSALFQSLLYEAVGRTINPVNGAVGLLWSGKWHLCQMGVDKVLRGGGGELTQLFSDESSEGFESSSLVLLAPSTHHSHDHQQQVIMGPGSRMLLHNNHHDEAVQSAGLVFGGGKRCHQTENIAGTPSEESESSTLGSGSGAEDYASESERKLLTLFL